MCLRGRGAKEAQGSGNRAAWHGQPLPGPQPSAARLEETRRGEEAFSGQVVSVRPFPFPTLSPFELTTQHLVRGSPTIQDPGVLPEGHSPLLKNRDLRLERGYEQWGPPTECGAGCSEPLGCQTESLTTCVFKAETKGGVGGHHPSPPSYLGSTDDGQYRIPVS